MSKLFVLLPLPLPARCTESMKNVGLTAGFLASGFFLHTEDDGSVVSPDVCVVQLVGIIILSDVTVTCLSSIVVLLLLLFMSTTVEGREESSFFSDDASFSFFSRWWLYPPDDVIMSSETSEEQSDWSWSPLVGVSSDVVWVSGHWWRVARSRDLGMLLLVMDLGTNFTTNIVTDQTQRKYYFTSDFLYQCFVLIIGLVWK